MPDDNMDVTQILGELTRLHKHTESAIRVLKAISRLEQNRLQNLPQLRKHLAEFDQIREQLGGHPELLEALQDWGIEYQDVLSNAEQEFRQRFGGGLEEELKQKGFLLSGQYPDLKAGLFTLELDFDREQVVIWYGPKQERLLHCQPDAREVANSVERVSRQLGTRLDKAEFLQRLQHAYSRVADRQSGEAAPIIDVLTELAYLLQSTRFLQDPRQENYQGYGRASFSYDLFLLRQSLLSSAGAEGHCVDKRLHLIVATRTHTRRRKDFLWIPDNESGRGTTYSHLQFAG
jgi:hypothetical protein